MQKALLKKQFLEINSYYFQNKKTGKRRKKSEILLFSLLYVFLFGFLCLAFFFVASPLTMLIDAGMGWLYGALMGMTALLMGTLGSAFTTYSGLYQAKDNDILLAMPIPPRKVLVARVAGVAMMGFIFETPVLLPAFLASLLSGVNGWAIPCGIVLYLAVGVLITALSCLLGWLVALLSARFKNKSALTVIFSLLFLGVYYYLTSKMNDGIQSLLANSEQVGEAVKSYLYPFYQLGLAWMGNGRALLIFVLLCAALMALVWLALTKTFLGIATKKESQKKAVYREGSLRIRSIPKALFRKELTHFSHSPTYMLNCGLGVVMMLAAAVLLPMYREQLGLLLSSLPDGFSSLLPVMLVGLVCFGASMNDISSPSVSLEGRQVWILQSMPISVWDILKSKLRLHEVMTLPPACLLLLCAAILLGLSVADTLLALANAALFVLATARMGLILNLKAPSMNWTNETVPVKQSMAVLLAMLGSMVITIGLCVGCYFLCQIMACAGALALASALLGAVIMAEDAWLKKKGTSIFSAL